MPVSTQPQSSKPPAHPGEGRGPDDRAQAHDQPTQRSLTQAQSHTIWAPAAAGVSGRENPPLGRLEPIFFGVGGAGEIQHPRIGPRLVERAVPQAGQNRLAAAQCSLTARTLWVGLA